MAVDHELSDVDPLISSLRCRGLGPRGFGRTDFHKARFRDEPKCDHFPRPAAAWRIPT